MKVYVTEVSHRHGRDMWINATAKGGRAALLEYVKENWSEVFAEEGYGGDGEWRPEKNFDETKPDETIEAYFDASKDEYVERDGQVVEVGP